MEGSTTAEGAQQFGGTPTATRPTASTFNVAMTTVLLAALPPLVYYMWICLEYFNGKLALPTAAWVHYFPWPTWQSTAIVAGWFIFQGLLQIYAPGKWIDGTPLSDGRRLQYKMNGWFSWWFTWAVIVAGIALKLFSPTILADQFGHSLPR